MNGDSTNTTAVIMSGGGAYAAFEVGVLKALLTGQSPATNYLPLKPQVITGTSAGAYNAALLVSNSDYGFQAAVKHLEDIWLDLVADKNGCGNGVFRWRGDLEKFARPECLVENPVSSFFEFAGDAGFFAQNFFQRGSRFILNTGDLRGRLLELVDLTQFIDIDPLRQLIKNTVSMPDIRRSDILLRIAATNWDSGIIRYFDNDDMADTYGHEIIMASAAIPGVFPAVEIAGDIYVDGGLVQNTPLRIAIDVGGDILHVILLDPDVANIPLRRLQNTFDAMDRIRTILYATITNEDMETASWINQGLRIIEQARTGNDFSNDELKIVIRVIAQITERKKRGLPYRKLTVHIYKPEKDLGSEPLSLLNFDYEMVKQHIRRGFADAANHDCKVNKCLIPN